MPRKPRDEFDYVMSMSDLGRYVNKWIVVVNNRVVAEGTDAKEVFDRAKKRFPDREPLIMKVPANRVMLL